MKPVEDTDKPFQLDNGEWRCGSWCAMYENEGHASLMSALTEKTGCENAAHDMYDLSWEL